jgi:hypothetical protein
MIKKNHYIIRITVKKKKKKKTENIDYYQYNEI